MTEKLEETILDNVTLKTEIMASSFVVPRP